MGKKIQTLLAHSRNDKGNGIPETHEQHSLRVAELASQFAKKFGAEELGYILGLVHDLKGQKFTEYLLGEREKGGDHKSIPALLSLTQLNSRIAATCVEGHHGGLTSLLGNSFVKEIKSSLSTDKEKFSTPDPKEAMGIFNELLELNKFHLPQSGPWSEKAIKEFLDQDHYIVVNFFCLMMFSCLVDADWLATEGHFNGNAENPYIPRPSAPKPEYDKAIKELHNCVKRKKKNAKNTNALSKQINKYRNALFKECLKAGELSPGIYTLTAPTGFSKTMGNLAMALTHAKKYNKDRIIVTSHFLNIIEQTVKEYGSIFQDFPNGYAIEDHSLVEMESYEKDSLQRLFSQNWDPSIIFTSFVKLFESMFHNKPMMCRKLHNLVNSVLILDEVQCIPPKYIKPILCVLNILVKYFNVTIIFSTATQPAFTGLSKEVEKMCGIPWAPKEIVSKKLMNKMFDLSSQRTNIEWRNDTPIETIELANELRTLDGQVCVIVNTKRISEDLVDLLRDLPHARHINNDMPSLHRKNVLKEVKLLLENGKKVLLIATQCIEAGVNIDFPVVYRQLAPFDSLGQAKGRCGRNGLFTGNFIIFELKNVNSLPAYGPFLAVTRNVLNIFKSQGKLNDKTFDTQENFEYYYNNLYSSTSVANMKQELKDGIDTNNFAEIKDNFKIINEAGMINVLCPYPSNMDKGYLKLMKDLESTNNNKNKEDWMYKKWVKRARSRTITIFRPANDDPRWGKMQEILFDGQPVGWYNALEYDDLIGFPIDGNIQKTYVI